MTEQKTTSETFSMKDFLHRTTDGSQREGPREKNFDFAGFYDWNVGSKQLLLAKDELTWLDSQVVPDRAVDTFVNLSCGTQLAPHLTLEIVDILKALGIDFIAASGRQFCCGKTYRVNDRQEAGEQVSQSSLDRFLSWGAKTAVHTCNSCQIVFSDYTARNASAAPDLTNILLSGYLLRRLEELGDRVPWKRSVDAKVLLEVHGEVLSPVHAEAGRNVARLLALVPGVQVLGEIGVPTGGKPCKTRSGAVSVQAYLAPDDERRLLDELAAMAEAAGGANTIVPIAHFCQREWSKFDTQQLAVRHYVSIVAQALGCDHPDRFKELWKLHDPEAVVERTRANWESWGIDQEAARRLAHRHFRLDGYGESDPQCACGGDPTKCNTGRNTAALINVQPEAGHQ